MQNNLTAYYKPYMLLAPALLVLVVFFLGGLAFALLQSFGYFPVIGLNKLSLEYYSKVLGQREFYASLGFTFYISFVSTALSTIVAIYLANYMVNLKRKNKFIDFLYKLPIAVPHIVAALMVVFLLSQGGFVARIFFKLGLLNETAQFPPLFYSRSAIGIILIYMWKEIPFITLMVYTVMNNIHKRLGEAASTLKASPRDVFYQVTLPLSMPSIISASAIVFAFSFGAFEIPYLLGASYPKTLSVWAYFNYISPDLLNRPVAMVISIVLTSFCVLLVGVYYVFMKNLRQWG
ncbi:MAG: ABC transporter permease subunit [Bacillota bacterium]